MSTSLFLWLGVHRVLLSSVLSLHREHVLFCDALAWRFSWFLVLGMGCLHFL